MQKALFMEKLAEEEYLYNAMTADGEDSEEIRKGRTIIDFLQVHI